jgi:S1-C subfamily serine protease
MKVKYAHIGAGGSAVAIVNRPGEMFQALTSQHIVRHTQFGPLVARFYNGPWFPVVAIRENVVDDLALLVAPPPRAAGCESLVGSNASQGDRVRATGWPPSNPERHITDGIVRSVVLKGSGTRQYLHTAPYALGMSGGGLWDSRGALIGINDSIRGYEVLGRRIYLPGMSFAVHTSRIKKFLARGDKSEAKVR